VPINDRLKSKLSNFQPKSLKRPYENTANYQNSMKQNRIDPRVFSVYKILEPSQGISSDLILYVESGYVDNGYIIEYDKFNPPGDPL
jgi:hypothetical protein